MANDQYSLEMSWSTRLTDDIVLEAMHGGIPPEMESKILETITHLNTYKYVDNKDIYIKMFSLLLKDKVSRPIQALATQLGYSAGIKSAPPAFVW